MIPRRDKDFALRVDEAIGRIPRGIDLAPIAGDMITNGFFPIRNIPLLENSNGAANNEAGQSGDFSALLFLIFAAPGAFPGPAANAGEMPPATSAISEKPSRDSVALEGAGSGGAKNPFTDASPTAENPNKIRTAPTAEDRSSQAQVIEPAIGGEGNALDSALRDAAVATQADNSGAILKKSADGSLPAPAIPAKPTAPAAAANADLAPTQAPFGAGGEQPQSQGIARDHSIYVKDHLGQVASTLADESSATDGGEQKLDRQSGVTFSETIHSIRETHSTNTQQREQGTLFQPDDHEPAPVPTENMRLGGAAFRMENLVDGAPSGARGAEPREWRPMIEHIAGEMNGHIRIGKTEAVIQLDPPELGQLKIDLHLNGDKLEARIRAESHESRLLIEAHLPELRQALGENRLNSIDVRIDSGAWTSAGGEGWRGSWQGAGGHSQPAMDFGGTARSDLQDRDPIRERPAPRGSGRVSMWA